MKRVVTLGGGTGHFTLLSGLKKYSPALSAIVSMADDGGSTGVLRDELGVLPPGDVRQCLVALSESPQALRDLMNYRFEEGSLKGHSFGNLFLSALEKMNGSFSKGVIEAMHILAVRGEVIPVTEQMISLKLELNDGSLLSGQNSINHASLQHSGVKRLFYKSQVIANSLAIQRIANADLIVIGPGNHYCSILPLLLIPDIAEALRKTSAKIVYVVNLTNKKNHTDGFNLDTYVQSVESYIGKDRINFVIFNTGLPPQTLVEKYALLEGGTLVPFSSESNLQRKYSLIKGDFVSPHEAQYNKADALASTIRSFIRHDPDKLAAAIMKL